MPYNNPPNFSRRSLRLPDYDYSRPGAYFVTMVTFQREHLFGEIKDGEMHKNVAGKIVWEIWQSLPSRYPNISLDEAVVMPNHFHGIVVIEENPVDEAGEAAIHELPPPWDELPPPWDEFPPPWDELPPPWDELPKQPDKESYRLARRKMLLPLVMGYFKMNSAKRINILLNSSGVPIWQRNYYERIVRNGPAYNSIRQYIRSNPTSWNKDKENR